MKVRVMGIDAAFSNVGFAIADVDLTDPSHPVVKVVHLDILQTEGVKKRPKGVPRSHDDLRRARLAVTKIRDLQRIWEPDYVVAEVPFGSQSARASWALGIALGVLASVPGLIEVTPRQVKAATGEPHADKDLMIEWAMDLHPDAGWRTRKLKGNVVQVASVNEHIADALATIYAGLDTKDFKSGTGIL